MWSDNAASVDLLGYEDLLHEIVELALDESLQPLTIGAFADWGAGKSTLLRLTADALRGRGALVVEFSPWLVEGYDDVKSCLLDAVVDEIERSQPPETRTEKVKGLLRSLRGRIDWLRLAKLGATAVVPIVGVAIDTLQSVLKPTDDGPRATRLEASSTVSRGFHREFEDLVRSAEGIGPVVVLIDDLDRCLPKQVIATLEAIRLFLSAPGTAFVIAADERLVRDAVRRRYAAASEIELDLPREYLEKLVHIALRIPPLSRVDTESYCNLLVAQRLLEPSQFDHVVSAAQRIRRSGELQVSCNVGIVRATLDEANVPAALEAEFGLIEQLIGPLASGLKGNPRQIKRYLNTLDMRRRTARRRGIEIDEAVLAKLVVLEYVRDDRYRELHSWQQRGGGLAAEIARLEAALDDASALATDGTVGGWASDTWTRDWLAIEPALSGVDLAKYFFLSRDRVADAGASSRLSPRLQLLIPHLEVDSPVLREPAVDTANKLDLGDQTVLIEACAKRLKALPDKQPMMLSMIEIAASNPAIVGSVVAALAAVPYPQVPVDIPLVLAGRFTSSATTSPVGELLATWERQGASARLSKVALTARKRLGT